MNARLLRLWYRALRRFGPYPLAALALLLLSGLFIVWIVRLGGQSDALNAALVAKLAAQTHGPAKLTRRVAPSEQVSDFVAALPPLKQSTNDLEQLFSSARQSNVQLLQGEYKFRQEPNEPLAYYTATFPVRADYAAIRDFSADVLRELPNASMEELRMTRSSAGSTVLEAVIRFSFVYRR